MPLFEVVVTETKSVTLYIDASEKDNAEEAAGELGFDALRDELGDVDFFTRSISVDNLPDPNNWHGQYVWIGGEEGDWVSVEDYRRQHGA